MNSSLFDTISSWEYENLILSSHDEIENYMMIQRDIQNISNAISNVIYEHNNDYHVVLTKNHDILNKILSERFNKKFENFISEIYEQSIPKIRLKNTLSESIRDIRQFGSIQRYNQELLERIGVNPSRVQKDLIEYVDKERDSDDYTIIGLFEYLDTYSNHLLPAIEIKSEYIKIKNGNEE